MFQTVPDRSVHLVFEQRQRDDELGTVAFAGTVSFDMSAMCVYAMTDDGQAEPETVMFGAVGHAELMKLFEQMRKGIRSYATSAVSNDHTRFVLLTHAPEFDETSEITHQR